MSRSKTQQTASIKSQPASCRGLCPRPESRVKMSTSNSTTSHLPSHSQSLAPRLARYSSTPPQLQLSSKPNISDSEPPSPQTPTSTVSASTPTPSGSTPPTTSALSGHKTPMRSQKAPIYTEIILYISSTGLRELMVFSS